MLITASTMSVAIRINFRYMISSPSLFGHHPLGNPNADELPACWTALAGSFSSRSLRISYDAWTRATHMPDRSISETSEKCADSAASHMLRLGFVRVVRTITRRLNDRCRNVDFRRGMPSLFPGSEEITSLRTTPCSTLRGSKQTTARFPSMASPPEFLLRRIRHTVKPYLRTYDLGFSYFSCSR